MSQQSEQILPNAGMNSKCNLLSSCNHWSQCRFDPAERSVVGPAEHPALVSEDSNSNLSQEKWGDYYMNEDDYAMQEPGSEPESDSDFEYEGGRTKRGKGKKSAAKSRPSKSSSSRSRRQDEEKTPSSDSKAYIPY